jgi:hypothetical protein
MSAFVATVLVLLVAGSVHGTFESTPKDFAPKTTKSISLRCEPPLEDVVVVLAIHIRKKTDGDVIEEPQGDGNAPEENPGDQPAISKENQDQAQTRRKRSDLAQARYKRTTDKDFVSATLTPGDKINTTPTLDRFAVNGSLKEPVVFLALSIANPDSNDVGIYECQSTALNEAGSVISTSEILQVQTEVELTVYDLEERVKKIEYNTATISELSEHIRRLSLQDKRLTVMIEEDVGAMRKEIKDLVDTVTAMSEQMADLGRRINYLDERVENQGRGDIRPEGTDNKQAEADMALRLQEFANVKLKLEHIESTQLQSLARRTKDLKETDVDILNRLNALELAMNTNVNKRISFLENLGWRGMASNVNEMQTRIIPIMMRDIMDCQRNITELQSQRSQGAKDAPKPVVEPVPVTTAPTTQPATPQPTFSGPACYQCGRNETEEHCQVSMVKNAKECPPQQPNCITDVYQDGITRHVYKRCASVKDCQAGNARSSSACATDPFFEVTPMKCHFCCTTPLCNDSLRPNKDLYR